ncbi:hypothetical protein QQS21_007074 [Conoideocrella luteorostrata]|uniref:Fe2OG dioxygenase domain-containing protein n=1 Tax=Conoideocrella luteorostrata TaxID=1105319 RepID=A0AAJ0CQT5_9HYPO|nr:hypothetical protein QQS21_007074 [Conoideocrella luteorostrata]
MGSVPAANVPRIDISPLFGDNHDKKLQVAKAIDAASRDTGFFYAVNHGVDLQWLSSETRKFHMSMTHEEKWDLAIRAYNQEHQHKIRSGYSLSIPGKKAVESLCYLNPSFRHGHPRIETPTPLHEANDWPDEAKHPGFRDFAESYFWEAFRVSSALLRGYALALNKDEDFFARHFRKEDTLSSVVLIRYPFLDPYPEPAIKTADDGTKLSFEWHEDVDLITVLYQSDVQNLQVKTPQGWLDIEPDDTGYLVNCGSYMAHITDNYYPAPIHRVVWRNEERQSLPFFVNLGYEDKVEPWDAAGKGVKPDREATTYGDYLQNGLLGLIKKNGQT